MSELGWAAIVVILLVFIGLLFVIVWHGGEKPNGLDGEMEERLTAAEIDIANLKAEMRSVRAKINSIWGEITRTLIDWYSVIIERIIK